MESIETFGILHPCSREGNKLSLEGDTLSIPSDNGAKVTFKKIFPENPSQDDLSDILIEKYARYCSAGFDVSVVVIDSSTVSLESLLYTRNSKSSLFSKKPKEAGILQDIIRNILQKTEHSNTEKSQQNVRSQSKISSVTQKTAIPKTEKVFLSCYDILDNQVDDLLYQFNEDSMKKSSHYRDETPTSQSQVSSGMENMITCIPIHDLQSGIKALQAGIAESKSLQKSEDKDVFYPSSFFFELSINHRSAYATDPYKSHFRVIKLPSIDRSIPTGSRREVEDKTMSNRHLALFQELLKHMADTENRLPPIYRDSLLMTKLRHAFGGNSITSCIIGLEDEYNGETLTIFSLLNLISRIRNYPVINTYNSQRIIKQYDKTIDRLQNVMRRSKTSTPEDEQELRKELEGLHRSLRRIEEERAALITENSSLRDELAEIRVKFTEQVESKTHLSSRMVVSEEEKLRMSKDAVELQLENNQIKQNAERMVYEIKSKCASLQDKVKSLERHLAVEKRKSNDLQEEINYLRKEQTDLTNEYVNIKYNHATLSDAYEKQMAEKHHLVTEIENLMSTKEELLIGRDAQEINILQRFQEQLRSITAKTNIDSEGNQNASTETHGRRNSNDLEKQLLVTNQERTEKLENLRLLHNKDLEDFEKKIDEIRARLRTSEERSHRLKLKIAEQNGEKIVIMDRINNLESTCNSQSTKINQISNDYAQRLEEYIRDLKDYLSSQGVKNGDQSNFIAAINGMLDDLKTNFNDRIQELTTRLSSLMSHVEDMYQNKEALLTAYKMLLWKVDEKERGDFDVNSLDLPLPSNTEIKMAQTKERSDLQTRLVLSNDTIKELQVKVDYLKGQLADREQRINDLIQGKTAVPILNDTRESSNPNMNSIRRELREFTLNTQLELEQERAELLTRCQLSEQQLIECQAYIETYLARYQQEISYLRRMVGQNNHFQEESAYGPDVHQRARIHPLDRGFERGYQR